MLHGAYEKCLTRFDESILIEAGRTILGMRSKGDEQKRRTGVEATWLFKKSLALGTQEPMGVGEWWPGCQGMGSGCGRSGCKAALS